MNDIPVSDEAFARAFENCEIPNELFRHRDHLRLAFIYLRRYGAPDARLRIVESIRRYAVHHGAPQKYHETITLAWMLLVEQAVARVPAGANFEMMLEEFPDLLNKSVLQEYYSSELLASEAARIAFAAPDKRALAG